MSILNEAAYLYVYAKKLITSRKKVDRLKKKLQKRIQKFNEAPKNKKEKHKKKHDVLKQKLHEALQEHHQILKRLRHHHTAFAHGMQKESWACPGQRLTKL